MLDRIRWGLQPSLWLTAFMLCAFATGCEWAPARSTAEADEAAGATSSRDKDKTGGARAGGQHRSAETRTPYNLPEATDAPTLLAFIDAVQSHRPNVRSREEYFAHLSQMSTAVIAASQQILDGEADETQAARAAEAQFEAYDTLFQLGDEQAIGRSAELVERLTDDPREAVREAAAANGLLVTARRYGDLDEEEQAAVLPDVEAYFAGRELGRRELGLAMSLGDSLEAADLPGPAAGIYRALAPLFAASDDEEIAGYGAKMEGIARRLELPGNKIELTGTLLDGTPLDWEAYRGKVVLVDFWATWCGPCLHELPNVRENYELYHDQGFEVLGISLDTDRARLEDFVASERLPWVTLFSDDEEAQGWDHPMAARYGIMGIPTVILVDQQGTVVSMDARGPKLGEALDKLFGDPQKGSPPEGSPPEPKGEGDETAGNNGATATALADAAAPGEPGPTGARGAAGEAGKDEEAEEKPLVDQDRNPYLAPADLKTGELMEFVLRMRARPLSVRLRPGFSEALFEATDRLLEAAPDDKPAVTVAVRAQLEMLHERAIDGDNDADRQLGELVERWKGTGPEKLARTVRFYALEREALEADALPADEIAPLLARLDEFFSEERLERKHLRLASATVKLINRLPDDEEAEASYRQFGELFATSRDRRLKKYGKRISKGSKPKSWVGKPMELAGTTVEGDEFDWSLYRDKVVLVDFWATWCGPCVALLPHLEELREKYGDDGFEIVGVSVDEDVEELEDFLRERPISWTNIADTISGDALAGKYEVNAYPTTFLVDRQGKIAAVDLRHEALAARIEELLDDSAGKGPADAVPAEKGPAEKGPPEKGPPEKGPPEQGPAEKGPAEKGPAERTPADESPAEGAPAQ